MITFRFLYAVPSRLCHYLAITLLFIASQWFYDHVMHLPFDGDVLSGCPHYLVEEVLQNDLLQGLYYLHMQPPLVNLVFGIILKLTPGHFAETLAWLYYMLGLFAILYLYRTMERLDVRTALRWFVIIAICSFPTFSIFIRWGYVTHPEFCLCCFAIYQLALLQTTQRWTLWRAWMLFTLFCILGLSRPAWNPALFLIVLALLIHYCPPPCRYRFFAGATLAMVPLLLVMVKNIVVFDMAGLSSWFGTSIGGEVGLMLSKDEINHLKESGEVSAFFPPPEIPRQPGDARNIRNARQAAGNPVIEISHPALDRYNDIAYLDTNRQDLADALAAIRHYPWRYVSYVGSKMLSITYLPSLAGPGGMYEQVLGPYHDLPLAIRIIAGIACVVLYVIAPLAVLALTLRRNGYLAENRVLITSLITIAFLMYLTSCALIGFDLERQRWSTEPCYILLFALGAEALLRFMQRNKKGLP